MNAWATAHSSAMEPMIHFGDQRSASHPIVSADGEKSQKKTPANNPNSVWESRRSRIIGALANPNAALSQKLMSMNSVSKISPVQGLVDDIQS